MTNPAQADTASTDAQLAAEQVAVELAARDLYDAAIDAGADDPLWGTLREQHDSFAQRLSGLIGESAQGPSTDFFEQFADGFAVVDPAELAATLEDTLAAGYTAKLAEVTASVTGNQIASAFASILVSESRQAVVLAHLAGTTDPDSIFVNPITEAGA